LVTYTNDEEISEFGLRPFFFSHEIKNEKLDEKEFLYPFLSHKSETDQTRTRALINLMSYDTKVNESGFVEKDFRLYPFIFYRDSEINELDHFGIFPFYGNLKNFLGKEEIDFVLFPFYLSSKNEGENTESYLWPVFSKYSGNHAGGRVWPLYGKRTREKDDFEEKFILWPFYYNKSKEFYGEHQYQHLFFPFYAESSVLGIKNRSYLVPFISFTENEERGNKRWDIPWPLVNVSKGEVEQTRVFPFYSSSRNEKLDDKDGFILWPIFNYKQSTLYDYVVIRKSFLLFLYKDIEKISLEDNEKIAKRVHLWPFFSYERDEEGYTNIHAVTVFEPFVRSNERLYRNYSAFWRLYEKQKSPDGEEFTSFLWNIYSSRKSENEHSIEFKPLIPFVTYNKVGESKKINLFGGFLGFENKENKKYLKLLYFSIPYGEGDENLNQLQSINGSNEEYKN
ncbi:MAG: hypothetical protein ACRENO_05670, partial [Thermodesulfobacteriota bacterium]